MAQVFKSYREESRSNWGTTIEKEANLNLRQINTGAMLRIADAAERMATSGELMAKNNATLISDRDWYKNRCKALEERNLALTRSNAALKGHIKRLKKQSTNQPLN
ncbi:MAG: hypothetical protein ACTHKV_14910 [Flavipsychrobacter sp.]